MLQHEIKAVLAGTLLVGQAQQQLVHATAAAALAHINKEIETALQPLRRLRDQLILAQPSLQTALRTGATAGKIPWQSKAATAFQGALRLHQTDLVKLVGDHAKQIKQVETHIAMLEKIAKTLTTTHPHVLAMAATALAGASLAAGPAVLPVPTPMPAAGTGANHG